MTDELRLRLHDGDDEALAELFAENRERLARMVRFRVDRRLLGRLDPDDVLQEAFLESRQRLKNYRPESPMTPFLWLRHIVVQTLTNVHRRHLGAQRRDAGREIAIPVQAPPRTSVCLVARIAANSTSPSGVAIREETSRRLLAAVEGMDEIDREVLALRHFEELTNGETAVALGIEVKAASIRYFRALRRLKELLEETGLFTDYLKPSRDGR